MLLFDDEKNHKYFTYDPVCYNILLDLVMLVVEIELAKNTKSDCIINEFALKKGTIYLKIYRRYLAELYFFTTNKTFKLSQIPVVFIFYSHINKVEYQYNTKMLSVS